MQELRLRKPFLLSAGPDSASRGRWRKTDLIEKGETQAVSLCSLWVSCSLPVTCRVTSGMVFSPVADESVLVFPTFASLGLAMA